jgi:hypothetical protein
MTQEAILDKLQERDVDRLEAVRTPVPSPRELESGVAIRRRRASR